MTDRKWFLIFAYLFLIISTLSLLVSIWMFMGCTNGCEMFGLFFYASFPAFVIFGFLSFLFFNSDKRWALFVNAAVFFIISLFLLKYIIYPSVMDWLFPIGKYTSGKLLIISLTIFSSLVILGGQCLRRALKKN